MVRENRIKATNIEALKKISLIKMRTNDDISNLESRSLQWQETGNSKP